MAINKLHGLGNILYNVGNLPSSYTEALSYEEQLLWLLNYLEKTVVPVVNECIEKVNGFEVNFDEINAEITSIKNSIDLINSNLNALRTEIYANVDEKLEQQYNRILVLMNNYQTIFNARLNDVKNDLQHQIDEIQIGNVIAYDPTTGQYENINIVIQNIYDTTRENAITAGEFDALNLTCTQFASYDISAYNFDLNAKAILV